MSNFTFCMQYNFKSSVRVLSNNTNHDDNRLGICMWNLNFCVRGGQERGAG